MKGDPMAYSELAEYSVVRGSQSRDGSVIPGALDSPRRVTRQTRQTARQEQKDLFSSVLYVVTSL